MLVRYVLLKLLIIQTYSFNTSNFPFSNDDLCSLKTDMMIKHFINSTYVIPEKYSEILLMINFCGTNIDDLGNYIDCNNLGYSRYLVLSYEVSPKKILSVGICYFKECDDSYFEKAKDSLLNFFTGNLNLLASNSKLNFFSPQQKLQYLRNELKSKMIAGVTVLGLIFLIGLFSSLYLIIRKSKENNKSQKFLPISQTENSTSNQVENQQIRQQRPGLLYKFTTIFDFVSNLGKIFTINHPTEQLKALRVIDGVRLFMIFWVIFGHSFLLRTRVPIKDFNSVYYTAKSFLFTFIVSAYYAVDVFFFFSGFLFCLSFNKYKGKNLAKGKMIGTAIFLRYIRLFPVYVIALLVVPYLIAFTGNGPFYYNISMVTGECLNTWWANLLYINNLSDKWVSCLEHTWYLANDMQFFLISIFLYVFLNKKRKIMNSIFALIFLGSIVSSIVLTWINNYQYNRYVSSIDFAQETEFFDYFYIKPWVRICPYLMGIFFAEMFMEIPKKRVDYDEEENQTILKKFNRKIINSKLWFLSTLLVSLICIIYSVSINYVIQHHEFGKFGNAFMCTFNKVFFVLGLALMLHLTYLGKCNLFRKFLSLDFFTPLAKLTYGVYIFHLLILADFYLAYSSAAVLSIGDAFFVAVATYLMSVLISLFISCFFEGPIVNLTKGLAKKE